MKVSQKEFGKTKEGQLVTETTLENSKGWSVKVINLGGIITEINVPDRNGNIENVVLNFKSVEEYLNEDFHPYFGCLTGRVAGRMTAGKMTVEGKDYQLAINDGPNHLHGGKKGFDKKFYETVIKEGNESASVTIKGVSEDGDQGYPGTCAIAVTYTFNEIGELSLDYDVKTDKATPICLTNHSYFNLAAKGNVLDHTLQIFTDQYIPTDNDLTLLDRIEKVNENNTFVNERRAGDAFPNLHLQHGDKYFFGAKTGDLRHCATFKDEKSGRQLDTYSTETCMQFYTGYFLGDEPSNGFERHQALCLECQNYPNGVNAPEIEDIIFTPERPYNQKTVYRFSTL